MATNRILLLCLSLSACELRSAPGYGDPNQPYDQLPGTRETPHTKWLNPLAGGKLKVLHILPYNAAREVIELAQRLGQDHTVILCAGRNVWDEGYWEGANATPLHGAAARALLDELSGKRLSLDNHYDLIVIGHVSWPTLPDKARELILAHVRRGTGLVYVSPSRLLPVVFAGAFPKPETASGDDPLFTELFATTKDTQAVDVIKNSLPLDLLNLVWVKDAEGLTKNVGKAHRLCNLVVQSPVSIHTSKLDAGRIASLQYYDSELYADNPNTALTPYCAYRNDTMFLYDYYFALLAKCALWASGRELTTAPEIEFDVQPSGSEPISQTAFPAIHYWSREATLPSFARQSAIAGKIRFAAAGDTCAAFKYQIRDIVGRGVVSGKIDKSARAEIPFPVLAQGDYLIDLQVLDAKGGVLDFVSKGFRINADNQVKTVKTAKEVYQPGETIGGAVEFAKALGQEEQAFVSVVDLWGREVCRPALTLNPARTGGEFSVPVNTPLSSIWDVHCVIKDAKGEVAKGKAWVSIPDRDFDDFMCVSFSPVPGGPIGPKGLCVAQGLKRAGIMNAALLPPHVMSAEIAEDVERNGFHNVFYSENLGERELGTDYSKESDGLQLADAIDMVRKIAATGAPLNPKDFPARKVWLTAEWLNKRMEKCYIPCAKFASPTYLINLENSLLGEGQGMECSGFSPGDTRRFQEWCREEYNSDLSALNREWGCAFTDWSQVRGVLLMDAAKADQLPRWVDFRYFMRSELFTGLHVAWTDMLRRFAPGARSGNMEHSNFDFTKCKTAMTDSAATFASDLGGLSVELHQSFSGDDSFILIDGNTLRWEKEFQTQVDNVRYPWKSLFLGLKGLKIGMELFAGNGNALGGTNYLTADYSEPLPFVKNISAETLKIQSGIAKLINHCAPYRSTVAILWAQRNYYISRIFPIQDNGFNGGSSFTNGGAPEDALVMMNSLGIRPTLIGPDDLAAAKGRYRAIILPYNKGMSEREAAALMDFVKDGGLLIGANEPGICSQHGKILERPRLAELFPDTAKTNVVACGKGHAVYLSDAINGYQARLLNGDCAGSDSVALALEKYAGVKAPVEILGGNGTPSRNVLRALFRDGAAEYLGLLRCDQKGAKPPENVKVVLDGERHVWDVMRSAYLGRLSQFDLTLDMYPRFYALLPVNPKGVSLTTTVSGAKAGETMVIDGVVSFEPGAAAADVAKLQQVVNVKVIDPAGKELECHRRNVLFRGSAFKIELPVSHSEVPGKYKVKALNPFTGMAAETSFIGKN